MTTVTLKNPHIVAQLIEWMNCVHRSGTDNAEAGVIELCHVCFNFLCTLTLLEGNHSIGPNYGYFSIKHWGWHVSLKWQKSELQKKILIIKINKENTQNKSKKKFLAKILVNIRRNFYLYLYWKNTQILDHHLWFNKF